MSLASTAAPWPLDALRLVAQQPRPKPFRDHSPRCTACARILAGYVTRPWSIRCQRCKTENRKS